MKLVMPNVLLIFPFSLMVVLSGLAIFPIATTLNNLLFES